MKHQKHQRLLQIELVLSNGKVANVSRSDSGEILVHLAFPRTQTNQEWLNERDEATNAFLAAERAING